ncbi:MAG: hypothetical protein HFI86_05530 [Bacilli bacterium]|nr:hypothetical protein [Bacilli bacterium]
MDKKNILSKVDILIAMYKKGKLGGEVMPEDKNPGLLKNNLENYLYFTLPMALNYQRNSYILWEKDVTAIDVNDAIWSLGQNKTNHII